MTVEVKDVTGAILDDLTEKGVNGSHMVSTPDSLIGLRHVPSTKWKGWSSIARSPLGT